MSLELALNLKFKVVEDHLIYLITSNKLLYFNGLKFIFSLYWDVFCIGYFVVFAIKGKVRNYGIQGRALFSHISNLNSNIDLAHTDSPRERLT